MSLLTRLANLANKLDEMGHKEAADQVDEVLRTLSKTAECDCDCEDCDEECGPDCKCDKE